MEIVNKILKNLKEGAYKWKDIKQVEILKPGKKKNAYQEYCHWKISARIDKNSFKYYL